MIRNIARGVAFDGAARPEPYIHIQETNSHSYETLSKIVKGVCTQPITNRTT